LINGEDVGGTVVETVAVFQIEKHRQYAVFACEPDASGSGRILAAFLVPIVEYVIRC
jgi:hypothetical protein